MSCEVDVGGRVGSVGEGEGEFFDFGGHCFLLSSPVLLSLFFEVRSSVMWCSL